MGYQSQECLILFLKLSQSDWEKVHSSSFSEILSGQQPFKIPHACFRYRSGYV